jgi:hypothetical protein
MRETCYNPTPFRKRICAIVTSGGDIQGWWRDSFTWLVTLWVCDNVRECASTAESEAATSQVCVFLWGGLQVGEGRVALSRSGQKRRDRMSTYKNAITLKAGPPLPLSRSCR